jgi:hypothetical protein
LILMNQDMNGIYHGEETMTKDLLPATKETFQATETLTNECYNALLEDLLDLVKETVVNVRYETIKCKWEVGDRIVREFESAGIKEYVKIVRRLSKDLKVSECELYRCIEFKIKFPDFEHMWQQLPEGKNISWNKIKENYLPDKPLTRLALAFPHLDSLDEWGIVRWWEQQPDKNFVLYIKDPKYNIKLKVAILNLKEEAMTPLKEAFKMITEHYIMLKKWDRKDMDASDYARIHKCTRRLLLKSKGDIEKIKQAMNFVANQGYMEWTMETVEKKYPDAVRPVQSYEKYVKKPGVKR